jgi:ABC-2 type transport system permease protein
MLNAVARLFPYTWMSEGFRLATLKGLGISYLSITIIVLMIMASFASFLAMTFPKRRKTAESKLTVNCQYSYPKKRPGSFFH